LKSLKGQSALLFLLIASAWCFCNAFAGTKIQVKKTELNQINGQIQQLQKTLAEDQQQQINLQQQLKTSEVAISQLSQQVNQFNVAFNQEQTQLLQLKKSQLEAQKKLAMHRDALSQQLRAAYQLGQSQSFKLLLNHQNPNTLSRHLAYYRYLSAARLGLMSDIKHTLKQLADNLNAINQHQQNLKLLLSQKQSQQNQQLQAQAQRQRLIDALNQSVQSKQQRINVLISNQKALTQLVTQLQAQPQLDLSNQSFQSLRNKLAWPVKGPIAANFGSPLDVGDQRLSGVVIQAPEGTPVHAVSPGKVIFSNWLRGFGLLIIINHGNNYMSLYARNHTLLAKVGDRVNLGDVIATTGSSGGFNKTGLYFEIRQNGTPINPSTWCR
jgi:septal ring factor EnvC (AmiA/AmiB activator)